MRTLLNWRCSSAVAGMVVLLGLSTRSSADVIDPLALNSRPSAPYTIYLDFGGFSFSGDWGNDSTQVPGVTPAYSLDGNANAFSTTELTDMENIWSRVAEKYSWVNVNVTTVDPAVAAGKAGTDAQRQAYYDQTAKLMHTVIGGMGSWLTADAGGVSYLGITGHSQTTNGFHTNWVFSAESSSDLQFIADGTAHENGHGFGLSHQSDYNGNTLVNEYSAGDSSRAPIMGDSYTAQRSLWKIGPSHVNDNGPTTQNDVQTILTTATNPGITIVNDGIGHTMATATSVPLSGSSINFNTASGVIAPSKINPTTSGLANYTTDFWSFRTNGGAASITVNSGRDSITPGVADPGSMLDASLLLLNSTGATIASATTSSLSETINKTLSAGTYFVEVLSAADPGNTGFFDLGSYFLTGSIASAVTNGFHGGDLNQDGVVNAADVIVMEQDLAYLNDAQRSFGSNFLSVADINQDGRVNNADLQALIAELKLGGGSSNPVPEPSSLALLALGGLALICRNPRWRRPD